MIRNSTKKFDKTLRCLLLLPQRIGQACQKIFFARPNIFNQNSKFKAKAEYKNVTRFFGFLNPIQRKMNRPCIIWSK